jgi:hypothetical protein
MWSIIEYLLTRSSSFFLKFFTKTFTVLVVIFLTDSLNDSWQAHDILIDMTGLPYSKIILKASILLTTITSIVINWQQKSHY